jgi:hypothetical protein
VVFSFLPDIQRHTCRDASTNKETPAFRKRETKKKKTSSVFVLRVMQLSLLKHELLLVSASFPFLRRSITAVIVPTCTYGNSAPLLVLQLLTSIHSWVIDDTQLHIPTSALLHVLAPFLVAIEKQTNKPAVITEKAA